MTLNYKGHVKKTLEILGIGQVIGYTANLLENILWSFWKTFNSILEIRKVIEMWGNDQVFGCTANQLENN